MTSVLDRVATAAHPRLLALVVVGVALAAGGSAVALAGGGVAAVGVRVAVVGYVAAAAGASGYVAFAVFERGPGR